MNAAMRRDPEVLLLAFPEPRRLSERLEALGFRTRTAAHREAALRFIDAPDSSVRAALLPPRPDLPDLRNTLDFLRERSASGDLRFVVVGSHPGGDAVGALIAARLRLALWEPFSDTELRFLVNHALYDPRRGEGRVDPRVPTSLEARILGGPVEKTARVYSLSRGGAFLETPRPTPVGGEVFVELCLPGFTATLQGEVVSNNVVGNLEKSHMPRGMGVRFGEMDRASAEAIARFVDRCAWRFQVAFPAGAPPPPPDPAAQALGRPEPEGGTAPSAPSVAPARAPARAPDVEPPASQPDVLIVDPAGDLADICALLRDLGVRHARTCRLEGAVLAGVFPRRLLVAAGGAAQEPEFARGRGAPAGAPDSSAFAPVRIAIVAEGSDVPQASLRSCGFQYVVQRPVHPFALRFLFAGLLYRGVEKRSSSRLPIGAEVQLRAGLRRRPALLAELSARGCRLLTTQELEPDTPITIDLPKDLTEGEALSLAGWVLRSELLEDGAGGHRFGLGVAFEALDGETIRALRSLLSLQAPGPVTLPPAEAATLSAKAKRSGPRRTPPMVFTAPRRFEGQVAAMGTQGMRTLIGRNLSTSGMVVEPHPELAVGDEFCLAIFGGPGERVVLRARVARALARGLELRFQEPPDDERARLEALVRRLPSLLCLEDGGDAPSAAVVGEITPTDGPPRRERGSGSAR